MKNKMENKDKKEQPAANSTVSLLSEYKPAQIVELVNGLTDEEIAELNEEESAIIQAKLDTFEYAKKLEQEALKEREAGAPIQFKSDTPVSRGEASRLGITEAMTLGGSTELFRLIDEMIGDNEGKYAEEGRRQASAVRQARIEQAGEEQKLWTAVGNIAGAAPIAAAAAGLGTAAAGAAGVKAGLGLATAGNVVMGAVQGALSAETAQDLATGRETDRATGAALGGTIGGLFGLAGAGAGAAAKKLGKMLKGTASYKAFTDKARELLEIGEGTWNQIIEESGFGRQNLKTAVDHIYNNADRYLTESASDASLSGLQKNVYRVANEATEEISKQAKKIKSVNVLGSIDEADQMLKKIVDESGGTISSEDALIQVTRFIQDELGDTNIGKIASRAVLEGGDISGQEASNVIKALVSFKPAKGAGGVSTDKEKMIKTIARNLSDKFSDKLAEQFDNPAAYNILKQDINTKHILEDYLPQAVNKMDDSLNPFTALPRSTRDYLEAGRKVISNVVTGDPKKTAVTSLKQLSKKESNLVKKLNAVSKPLSKAASMTGPAVQTGVRQNFLTSTSPVWEQYQAEKKSRE